MGGRWHYGALNSESPRRLVQYAYQHAKEGEPLKNNCVPYRAPTDPPVWRNYDSYQIIAAGFDNDFGTQPPHDPSYAPFFRVSKTGENFTQGDYDNITNFSERRLEDEIE